MTWPEYLFLKKTFQIPLRIKWSAHKRYICGSRGGQTPLCVLGYRLVKTYFNKIFPVSSLSFFFLPCLVIFALNYVSVSFDISIKKWFLKCLDLPLRYMYMCTLSYSVVCRQFEKMVQRSVADCVKFSVLVNKCVRPSCSLGTLHILKRQNKTKPGTHHIMYNFCSMRLGFDVSRYLLGNDHLT